METWDGTWRGTRRVLKAQLWGEQGLVWGPIEQSSQLPLRGRSDARSQTSRVDDW